MKSALALRHVIFEDLDGLEPVLKKQGFDIQYRDALIDVEPYDPLEPDLMIVLGSPTGIYENKDLAFIDDEIEAVRKRVENDRPVLGLCFGAQVLAKAMGANVYSGSDFEFGWSPLKLTEDGEKSAVRHFSAPGREVFHCHGDTFDLPEGAVLLASSNKYLNQAFKKGRHLGLQFHGEVSEKGLRRWYIGQIARARNCGGVSKLIAKTESLAPAMNDVHQEFLTDWLSTIGLSHTN